MRILFFLCFVATTYGQKLDELYIIIDKHSQVDTVGVMSKDIEYAKYRIYKEDKVSLSVQFLVEGGLLKKSYVKEDQKTWPSYELYYINDKGDNPRRLVYEGDMKNFILYSDFYGAMNPMELFQLIRGTKNLYLVYKDYKQDGFYIAKKVTLEPKFKLSVSSEEETPDF
ncbi:MULTISPECIES: hypothetical protein [Capnocytophaga]|uniref:hypothetical protein n=1 Tax=Capnocytophaga TaxID=1016 RepID=UPI00027C48A5|nr:MULTISPECIES: hypothetical protein [Capnocytophaga]EJU29074.1 hypothetical protein HMPREF1154_0648 [Capnocytophaga sp. CM59]